MASVAVDAIDDAILLSGALVIDDGTLRPSEETLAALAGDDSIMDARTLVTAHLARDDLNLRSDGIVTISSGRRCGGVGSEIGSRFAVEVVAVVVFVLANVLRFVVIVVDDAARLLTARSSRRETRFDRGRVLAQRRAGSEARRRMLVVVDRLQRRRDSCRCRFRTFTTHHQIGPRIDTATHH